jgi:ABC-type nitrate/sulfonate/bicarbonate transport system substrate-binding protein
MILARNGIDPEKDVQFVPLGTDSGRFAGLQQKLADAVITSPSWDFEGKKLGYNILARANDYVNYPLSGVGVHVKSIQQNRDRIRRTIKALVKASRFIRDHREEAVKILIAWGKAKPEHAYAATTPRSKSSAPTVASPRTASSCSSSKPRATPRSPATSRSAKLPTSAS